MSEELFSKRGRKYVLWMVTAAVLVFLVSLAEGNAGEKSLFMIGAALLYLGVLTLAIELIGAIWFRYALWCEFFYLFLLVLVVAVSLAKWVGLGKVLDVVARAGIVGSIGTVSLLTYISVKSKWTKGPN